MKEKIEQIIYSSLKSLNEELENSMLENPNEKTKLFGANSALDSLALVTLITDVETEISDEFGKEIVLADSRAMSQQTSPFRNVGTLTSYIMKLLEEE